MKNCTNHFLERWVERIVGIKDEKTKKDYIIKNKQMIVDHANKTFEHAEFIYSGQIGDNITRNYFIEDDIIYVTNTTNDAFITVYRIDFGFPPATNAVVRKDLMSEIKRLTSVKEEIEIQVLEEVDKKKHQADLLDEQIKIMKEQVANLELQRKFVNDEIKNINSRSLNTGLELKNYAVMLVNSKEYKDDIRSAK